MLICYRLIIQIAKRSFVKRFNMVIHYHYYNCLYREEPPWSACASGAGSLQASSNTQHKRTGRKSEDPWPGPCPRWEGALTAGWGLWEHALTLGDLQSWAGSTHSCLQEAIHPRAGWRSDVCGNLQHMGWNVETAGLSLNQNGAFCLWTVQHGPPPTVADTAVLNLNVLTRLL